MIIKEKLKGLYCVCKSPHISCPDNIMTARCMYCNKQPYSVVLGLVKWYEHKSGKEIWIEQQELNNQH